MNETFKDINGNDIYEGDIVEVLCFGVPIAKGKITEISLEYEGVAIQSYDFGNYKKGEGVFITPQDITPNHFRKIL